MAAGPLWFRFVHGMVRAVPIFDLEDSSSGAGLLLSECAYAVFVEIEELRYRFCSCPFPVSENFSNHGQRFAAKFAALNREIVLEQSRLSRDWAFVEILGHESKASTCRYIQILKTWSGTKP